MMERKLRGYLSWRAKLTEIQGTKQNCRTVTSKDTQGTTTISAALQKKDQEKAKRAASRRRVRGGAPDVSVSNRTGAVPVITVEEDTVNEDTSIAELCEQPMFSFRQSDYS